jgi:hypothetical protein
MVLADEIIRAKPSMEWKRCLAIARAYYDPNRKVGPNTRTYGISRGEFVLRLVCAHIRHDLTSYDLLLANGYSKDEARRLVQPDIDRWLARWSA